MSTNYLYIIPKNPWVVPNLSEIEQALNFLREIVPDYGEIKAVTEEVPLWLHPVENYETILCPICKQDIEKWWWTLVKKMYDQNWFAPLDGVQLPCCQAVLPMNELEYHSDTGFACFRIEIRDPGISRHKLSTMNFDITLVDALPSPEKMLSNQWFSIWLSGDGLEQMSVLLGCPLKQFYGRI